MLGLTPSIHPFPARIAPEIAIEEPSRLNRALSVLDPMSGSGTVLRAASELGHDAMGFDLDPLAVLMARVWTTRLSASRLLQEAEALVAKLAPADQPILPWID